MNQRAAYTVFLLLAVLSLPAAMRGIPARSGAEGGAPVPDSLVNVQNVYYYSMSDPELAKDILGELRAGGDLPGYELDMIEGDYHFNNRNFRLASFFNERAVKNDSIRMDSAKYAMALTHATFPHIELQNYGKVAEYLNESIKIATEIGDDWILGESYMVFAIILHSHNDKEKAYEYFESAIEALERSDNPEKYARLFDVYTNMALHKAQDNEYRQALKILSSVPEIIENIDPDGLPENLTTCFWKDFYNYQALILNGVGDSAGAMKSYGQWLNMDTVRGLNDYLIVNYLIESRQYDEAIEYCVSLDESVSERPFCNAAVISAQTRARIHELRNENDLAVKYYKQLVSIKDSIKVREQRSEALEYATIYETQRKDAEILEHTFKLENQRKVMSIWIILAITSIAALFIIIIIHRRKRAAYKVLAEKTRRWARDRSTMPEDSHQTGSPESDSAENDEPTAEDSRIMKEVRAYVEGQLQYRNPSLTLDTVAAELSEV